MSKQSTYGNGGAQARANRAYLEQRMQGASPLDLLVTL